MCLDFEILSAYGDDELPEDVKKDVQAHLAVCDACRNILKNIHTVNHNIHSLKQQTLKGIEIDFANKLIAALPAALPCPTHETLSAYSDKALDFTKFKEVKQHLTECNICDKKVKTIYALSKAIRNLPPVYKADEDFISKVISDIPQTEKKIIDFHVWNNSRIRRFVIAAGIALVGILVVNNNYTPQNIENVNITITAEDFLFSSPSDSSLDMKKSIPDIPLLDNSG